ncbi:hypothetical protein KSS87_016562, partial [Heliosperma pusillum]
MNNLLSDSFDLPRGQSHRDGDLEMGLDTHNSGELGLQIFSKKVQEIDKQYEKINILLRKLLDAHEESKAVTKAAAMKCKLCFLLFAHVIAHNHYLAYPRMEKDVDEVQKIAHHIKSKIEELDIDSLSSLQKPGCGKGTAIERARTTQTVALKKKLRDKMAEFQTLRENVHQEYREVVERRVYTVTGQRADEE